MIQNLLHDIIHNALQESVVQLAQSSSEKQNKQFISFMASYNSVAVNRH